MCGRSLLFSPRLLCGALFWHRAAPSTRVLQPELGSCRFLPLPAPDMQPGPRAQEFQPRSFPIATARALVWPPSSSPDSVHSLFPVSLPPRHSLPHVARGIFLKRTSGYFPPLHNPSGTPCGLQDKAPPLREWRVRLFTNWPCLPCVLLSCPPPHMPCAPATPGALQSKENPMPLDMLFLLPGIPLSAW